MGIGSSDEFIWCRIMSVGVASVGFAMLHFYCYERAAAAPYTKSPYMNTAVVILYVTLAVNIPISIAGILSWPLVLKYRWRKMKNILCGYHFSACWFLFCPGIWYWFNVGQSIHARFLMKLPGYCAMIYGFLMLHDSCYYLGEDRSREEQEIRWLEYLESGGRMSVGSESGGRMSVGSESESTHDIPLATRDEAV